MTGEQLRYLLAVANWSPRDLARRSGLRESAIARALQAFGEVPITVAHQQAILNAVNEAGYRRVLADKPIANALSQTDLVEEGTPPRKRGSRRKSFNAPQADPDVQQIRSGLAMTQVEFAHTFGLPLSAIQDWEGDPAAIKPAARAYLYAILANADEVQAALQRAVQLPGGSATVGAESGPD